MLTQHTPSLLTTIEKPHVDLEDQEGLRKPNQQIPYTHRSPLHLLTPISSHFCLLSFLSYVLSFFLPFLLSPLISYCSNLWNVHRPVVSMKFWFLKGTRLSFFFPLFRIWVREERAFMVGVIRVIYWQRDKKKKERKKERKSWDNIWQWFTHSLHHQGEIWT